MRILSTECSKEQQKEDMPELIKMHAQAMESEIMWEFFGGNITLPNGNKYQVVDYP
jgi:ribosomal protein S19